MTATEIERTVLGMMLVSQETLARGIERGLTPFHFTDEALRRLYLAVLEAEREGGYTLERITPKLSPPDMNELYTLHAYAPIAQNPDPYFDELLKLKLIAETRLDLDRLQDRLSADKLFEPAAKILAATEETAFRLLEKEGGKKRRGPRPIQELLDAYLPLLEDRITDFRSGKNSLALKTGFKELDLVMGGGFLRGTVNIIAARTGRGKTTLALNLLYAAAKAGQHAVYFSIEMLVDELLRKLVSRASEVSAMRLLVGELGASHLDKIMAAVNELGAYKIHFDDSTGGSFEALEASARRLHRQGQLDFMVVDYIQQFHLASAPQRSAHERLTVISHKLKQLALELKVPVVALAQLNRQAEAEGAEPELWHIKDSGAMEQDADFVMLLRGEGPTTSFYVAKNRHGAANVTMQVMVNLALNTFKDA